jgi:hypothetical protein
MSKKDAQIVLRIRSDVLDQIDAIRLHYESAEPDVYGGLPTQSEVVRVAIAEYVRRQQARIWAKTG